MIRAFVVDDESFSVQRLAVMLSRFGDVELVGSESIPSRALDRITHTATDVIFLDIEMPGLKGLELARKIIERSSAPPCIVFVTAYTEFAVGAFETGAIDFLVKPVQQKRLAAALDRVRGALESRFARDRLFEILGQLDRLRDDRARTPQQHDYLWINQRGKIVKIDLIQAIRISAEGEYVRIIFPDSTYLYRESLGAISDRLSVRGFVRVHRSHIVNAHHVVSVDRDGSNQQISLDDGSSVPVGRSYRQIVRNLRIDIPPG
jgi:two-component system LytT family response regulator